MSVRFPRKTFAVLKFAAYLAAAWAVPLVLFWDALWVRALVLFVAIYTTAPVFAYIRLEAVWPFYPRRLFRVLVMRVAVYTQALLPFVAGGGLLGCLVGAVSGEVLLGGRVGVLVVFGILMMLVLIGYLGSQRLVIRRIEVSSPGLPVEFDGFTVAQLTDLHIGPHVPRHFLEDVADTVRYLSPDMIAVTGDMVDDRSEDVALYAKFLGGLSAPSGEFMIVGNHDVYAGWPEVRRQMEVQTHVTILVNEAHILRRGDGQLAIVGVGDPAGRRVGDSEAAPDIARAFSAVPPGVESIVLAHNPVLWPEIAERGAFLTLSGHTHWGHIAIPRWGWSAAALGNEHHMSGYQRDRSFLYVAPGVGYWGAPFRLGAFPEITLVTLKRGAIGMTVGATRKAAGEG